MLISRSFDVGGLGSGRLDDVNRQGADLGEEFDWGKWKRSEASDPTSGLWSIGSAGGDCYYYYYDDDDDDDDCVPSSSKATISEENEPWLGGTKGCGGIIR